MEPSCVECKHSVYCESWGEYKCLRKSIRIKNPYFPVNCDKFKKSSEEKKVCRCKTCLSKEKEEE